MSLTRIVIVRCDECGTRSPGGETATAARKEALRRGWRRYQGNTPTSGRDYCPRCVAARGVPESPTT